MNRMVSFVDLQTMTLNSKSIPNLYISNHLIPNLVSSNQISAYIGITYRGLLSFFIPRRKTGVSICEMAAKKRGINNKPNIPNPQYADTGYKGLGYRVWQAPRNALKRGGFFYIFFRRTLHTLNKPNNK
jgi:hypothetical protein